MTAPHYPTAIELRLSGHTRGQQTSVGSSGDGDGSRGGAAAATVVAAAATIVAAAATVVAAAATAIVAAAAAGRGSRNAFEQTRGHGSGGSGGGGREENGRGDHGGGGSDSGSDSDKDTVTHTPAAAAAGKGRGWRVGEAAFVSKVAPSRAAPRVDSQVRRGGPSGTPADPEGGRCYQLDEVRRWAAMVRVDAGRGQLPSAVALSGDACG